MTSLTGDNFLYLPVRHHFKEFLVEMKGQMIAHFGPSHGTLVKDDVTQPAAETSFKNLGEYSQNFLNFFLRTFLRTKFKKILRNYFLAFTTHFYDFLKS